MQAIHYNRAHIDTQYLAFIEGLQYFMSELFTGNVDNYTDPVTLYNMTITDTFTFPSSMPGWSKVQI